MADYVSTCSDFGYRGHNSGWCPWAHIDEKKDGYKTHWDYAGKSSNTTQRYVAAIRFKANIPAGTHSKKLTLTIPFVRAAGPNGSTSTQAWDGNLFIKLYKSDPTGVTGSAVNAIIPGQLEKDGVKYGVKEDAKNSEGWDDVQHQEWFYAKFEVSTDCCNAGDAYTYATIGASSLIQCGGKSEDNNNGQGRAFSGTCEYYSNGGKPEITTCSDYGDNRCLVSGTLGISGTNNGITAATLYYTIDGSDPETSSTREAIGFSDPSSGKSFSEFIPKDNGRVSSACTVKVYLACWFEKNSQIETDYAEVKYYEKPSDAENPYLLEKSYKNDRLTIKKDWYWKWNAADPYNNAAYNAVRGYRVRLYIKKKNENNFVNNRLINYCTGVPLGPDERTNNDWIYDRDNNQEMPMRAVDQNLEPGDKVKLSVQAYSTNYNGTKLFSNECSSQEYTVQNAGVVQVKVASNWVEGQVWVKANNEWHEAETVNVKTSDGWEESQ